MRAALRYFGLFLGLRLSSVLAMGLVEMFVGPLGFWSNTGFGMIAVVGAAGIEGRFFAKRKGRIPERTEKRAFAQLALLVNVLLILVILATLVTFVPELFGARQLVDAVPFYAIDIAIIYFASGYFFAKYAKNWLAAQERKRARSAG